MSFRLYFAKQLKILRLTHNLSSAQLATLLSFQNKGSISHIESGKALPSTEVLDNVTDLFAVSLDWLAGQSEVIYRPEIIINIEEKLDLLPTESCRWMTLYSKYADTEKRQDTFSLPVRANIIFCRQIIHKLSMLIADEKTPLDLDFSPLIEIGAQKSFLEMAIVGAKKKLHDILYPLMLENDGKRRANISWDLLSTCYDYLQDYIVVADDDPRKRTTPVFDVEAAWKEKEETK